MTNGTKGFNRIAGADMLPMHGREVIECHQPLMVFLQTGSGLGVFRLIGIDKQVKGCLSIHFRFCLPNRMQGLLGLWLRRFWQAVQDIHIQQRCWRVSG